MANGLLFAAFDFSNALQDEVNDWYDLEHIPERLRVPGFVNAERWVSDENPNIVAATYDLASPTVMTSPAYGAITGANTSVWSRRVTAIGNRLLRFEGEQLIPGDGLAPSNAGGLLIASMNVDPAAEDEFTAWYNTEHLPYLAAVPGVISARRFRATGAGVERKYLALYALASPEVSRSDAWAGAAGTPWSARLRPFFRDLLVLRCKRYVRPV